MMLVILGTIYASLVISARGSRNERELTESWQCVFLLVWDTCFYWLYFLVLFAEFCPVLWLSSVVLEIIMLVMLVLLTVKCETKSPIICDHLFSFDDHIPGKNNQQFLFPLNIPHFSPKMFDLSMVFCCLLTCCSWLWFSAGWRILGLCMWW